MANMSVNLRVSAKLLKAEKGAVSLVFFLKNFRKIFKQLQAHAERIKKNSFIQLDQMAVNLYLDHDTGRIKDIFLTSLGDKIEGFFYLVVDPSRLIG